MLDTDASLPFGLVAATNKSGTSAKASRTGRSVKKRKFYEMDYVIVSTPSGWEVINETAVSPGGGRDLPEAGGPPRLS